MAKMSDITWPAARFTEPSNIVEFHKNETSFCRSGLGADRYLNALQEHFLVDSTGFRFDIGGAKFDPPISKCKAILFGVTRPLITMPIIYDHVSKQPLDLDEFKRLLTTNIEKFNEYWSEIADTKEIKAKIMSCNSHKQILKLPFFMS